MKLDVASELIIESYKHTLGIKETLAKQMFDIENRKVLDLHLSKLSKLTNEALDFKMELVVKR